MVFNLLGEGKPGSVPRQLHYPSKTSDAHERLQLFFLEFGLVDAFLEYFRHLLVVLAWLLAGAQSSPAQKR